jgi:hypothetical protein
MNEIEILTKFKTQLISFLDELIDLIPDDKDLVTLRVFVNDQIPIYDVMKSFITYIYPHKDKVGKREEKFLLSQKNIFISISPETFEKFKGYWISNYFDDNDRKVIWQWVDLFFKIGDEYLKIK